MADKNLRFLAVDNFSTMRRIRAALAAMPVLMITAEAKKENIIAAAQSGTSG